MACWGYKGIGFKYLVAGVQSPTTLANHEQMLSPGQTCVMCHWILVRTHRCFPWIYITDSKPRVQKDRRHKPWWPKRKRTGVVVSLCPGPLQWQRCCVWHCSEDTYISYFDKTSCSSCWGCTGMTENFEKAQRCEVVPTSVVANTELCRITSFRSSEIKCQLSFTRPFA